MAWTQLANNAKTTLDANCTDVATTISPTAKTNFPDPDTDGDFWATIWDADTYPDPGDDSDMEIVLVTADDGGDWTVTRGQCSTSGVAHTSGDAVRLLWLADHAQEIQDAVDANADLLAAGTDGTLVLDDGANWRVTVVIASGIVTSVSTAASSAATATWTPA